MADEPTTGATRSQLDRIARQLAADALEEAAARARGILVERLTEALVEEAERSLATPSPSAPAVPKQAALEPEPEAAATAAQVAAGGPERAVPDEEAAPEQDAAEPEDGAAPEQETGCYLFAIAQAGSAPLPDLPGMDGAGPVREVVSGHLAGVVCEIPLNLFDGLDQEAVGPESRLAELARRHDEVVRATFERRAVLPLRFGTVLTSDRQLAGVLDEQQSQLLPELRRLEGKAEWTCRIQPDPAAATTTRRQPSPVSGAAYLAERERDLAATTDEDPYGVAAAADQVSRAVEGLVESALPPDPAGEEARVSFLVPDDGQERFADAVASVAGASPAVRIELLGPHPPYHFASVQLGSDGR